MDDKYELNIMTKLIPMLNQYGLDFPRRPIQDKPGSQTYIGYDSDLNKIRLTFYNQHEDKLNNREGKYDMLVTIDYKGQSTEAGVVDLKSRNSLDEAFELITMTLEDLGFNIDTKEKETSNDSSELDDLANFKSSLSERELLEIEGN
jgi:hypothetical protein